MNTFFAQHGAVLQFSTGESRRITSYFNHIGARIFSKNTGIRLVTCHESTHDRE